MSESKEEVKEEKTEEVEEEETEEVEAADFLGGEGEWLE